jgi:general secretion pathway protein D
METVKPTIPFSGRVALLAAACMIVPVTAGEPQGGSGLASTELSRRSAAIEEAQELLRKGDESYTAGRYAEAVEAYAGARDLIPNAPVSAELRDAATERYAQASVEHARVLSRNGDVAAAKAAVDRVLVKEVAPNNPGALAFRNQLDDPIRTNPALTAEHAKNVDSVRRQLYTAQGAYDLGKFNEAKASYENVLRLDPTNTAARRGMEQVAAAKSGYQKSSYDHTRAEMLSQVDKEWELQVPQEVINPSQTDQFITPADQQVSVKNKLSRIIIPKVSLDQSSLEEALDFLRLRASENDTLELDPARKGVNFTINLGAPDSPAATKIRNTRFDLQLTNVPLTHVLKYITETTQTTYATDDFSVIITPAGSTSAELIARTYRVPPDFISTLSAGVTEGAAEDPFASEPSGKGLLAKRLGAQEVLAKQGVAFPQGALASYTPANNTLRVVNTPTNHDFISQIIETLTKTEAVTVSIRVTMIKVQKTRLEELGFDWLLDNIGFGGDSWIPGVDKLNLGGGTVGNGDPITDVQPPPGSAVSNPITSGNRSGDSAILGNSIDDVIGSDGRPTGTARAPGVLEITGETAQMLMRGLNQKKGTDVLAQPSIVTRSGQSSNIAMVREFIYPTEYEPPELPNSVGVTNNDVNGLNGLLGGGGGGSSFPVTPATPTAFDKKDVGISLEVLPVVDAKKQYINLTLNPSFSDFDGFVNYGSPINSTQTSVLGLPETVEITKNAILQPIFSIQRTSSSIDIADGATVVLGGLMQETVENVEDKTPILGSIPIVGRLFQSKVKLPTSTAIIFLVNVELMDPTGHRYRDR